MEWHQSREGLEQRDREEKAMKSILNEYWDFINLKDMMLLQVIVLVEILLLTNKMR